MRVIKTLAMTTLLALIMGSSVASASTLPHESLEQERPTTVPAGLLNKMQIVAEKANAQDSAGARTALQAVLTDPDFSTLPHTLQKEIMSFAGLTDAMLEDWPAAYDHLMAGGPLSDPGKNGTYYFYLSEADRQTGHKDQSLAALTTLAQVSPDFASNLNIGLIMDTSHYAASLGDNGLQEKQFLEALWAAHYQSPDIYQPNDYVWFSLFELEVAAGQDDKARELMTAFTEPETVIKLRGDNRYARFLKEDSAADAFQVRLDASIAAARDLVKLHPDSVEAVSNLAYRLAAANHLDEALNLTDDVLAKVAAAPKDKPVYDDQIEKLAWIHMTRSLIMARQNHLDKQLKAQESARDIAATSLDHVSQNINLGYTYAADGKPHEALDVIAQVDTGSSSGYGLMAADEVRACAYQQLGDKAKLSETLTYMKAHLSDGYNPYRHALMCSGDVDALAESLIARLDDPTTRNETLYRLQTYLPQRRGPLAQKWQQTATSAAARPDVQAAIAKYGKVEAYPVYEALE